jgi:predicted MFS family arabinose efflux permease
VIGAGLAIIAAGGIVGLCGISIAHFWIDLILLGLGWNFAFVGATAMVTLCHRPSERNKVQAVNDFLVFGAMAIGSFSSGQLLANFGWAMVNQVVLPVVLIAATLLLWVMVAARAKAA